MCTKTKIYIYIYSSPFEQIQNVCNNIHLVDNLSSEELQRVYTVNNNIILL